MVRMDDSEPVAFVNIQSGDDLIVSFFVRRRDDPSDGRSVTLMRSLKWEHLLADWERGVTVSDENVPDEEEAEVNLLEHVRLSNSMIEIGSTQYQRKLDLRKIDESDRKAVKRLLKKMNFDKRFRLEFA